VERQRVGYLGMDRMFDVEDVDIKDVGIRGRLTLTPLHCTRFL
jgi:hypothetical protein